MGESKWNAATQNWEYDGKPMTYRVTWKIIGGDGEVLEREYDDIDQGYDFYQDRRLHPECYGATWEHVAH